MIIVNKEVIYGMDVFTFNSSKNIPYQLTFQKDLSERYYIVSLVNLLGQNDSPYCKEFREVISEIVYDYIFTKKCKLFFDIEFSSKKNFLLLMKFLRWIELDKRIDAKIEITNNFKNVEYVEVFLELNVKHIEQIEIIE